MKGLFGRRVGLGAVLAVTALSLNWCHPPTPDFHHDWFNGNGELAIVAGS